MQFLIHSNTYLPFNPGSLHPDIHPREMEDYVHTKTCIKMCIIALFIIDKNLKNALMNTNEKLIAVT